MITLPDKEYVHRDGKTYCTMRQQVLHCIGMDGSSPRHRPYTRHGRKFYKPWRNYFSSLRNDRTWEPLVEEGYAGKRDYTSHYTTDGGAKRTIEGTTYWMTRKGLDWIGEQIGVTIHDEEK